MRNKFRVVLLDPSWDNILRSFETPDPDALLECVERWLHDDFAG